MAPPSSPLVTFFNFQYYLALSPFGLERDKGNGKLALKRNRVQMIFCGIIHFISVGFSVSTHVNEYEYHTRAISSNISGLLGFIGIAAASFVSKYIIKLLWINQNEILDFLRSLEAISQQEAVKTDTTLLPTSSCSIRTKITPLITSAVIVLIYSLHMYVNIVSKLAGNATDIMLSLFVDPNKMNACIHGIYLTIVCHSTGVYATSRLATMILCIEYFILGRRFEKLVVKEVGVKTVIEKFEALKMIVAKGKSWTNTLLIWACIGVLAFVANIPQMIRGEAEPPKHSGLGKVAIAYLCGFYSAFGILFVLAADMPSKVCQSCKRWIYHKRLEPDLTESERFLILSLSQEIEVEPVGLSCTYFTVTFNFLGTLFGLVVTYGVLVFQIRK